MGRGAIQRRGRRLSLHAREHRHLPALFVILLTARLAPQYADVRRLLHSTALSLGAKIIPEARISLIDFEKDERPFVRLTSGEILGADVIVGTDGPHSIARRMVLEQDADEIKLGMSIFK